MEYNKRLIRPKGLSRENLHEIKNFAVSYKIDGEHRFLVLEKDRNPQMIDLNNSITILKDYLWTSDKYVVEGELYGEKFYAFDIIMNGKDISNLGFKNRYQSLQDDENLKTLPFFNIKEFLFCSSEKNSSASEKQRQTTYKLIKELKTPQYKTDGLIFMPESLSFFDKRVNIYKWKPVEQLTADFLCLQFSENYKVYCSMNIYQFKELQIYRLPKYKKQMPKYFPIEFSPFEFGAMKVKHDGENIMKGEAGIFHDKIVECVWDKTHWKPYRIRDDKTTAYLNSLEKNEFTGPNNWTTCLQIYKDSLQPLLLEDITEFL